MHWIITHQCEEYNNRRNGRHGRGYGGFDRHSDNPAERRIEAGIKPLTSRRDLPESDPGYNAVDTCGAFEPSKPWLKSRWAVDLPTLMIPQGIAMNGADKMR